MKIYLLMVNIYKKPIVIEYSWWLDKKPYCRFPDRDFAKVHSRCSRLED